MAEVQLSEIEKQFGEKPVLRRLNLTVPAGQYLVLLGKSGGGKSTLLKIIAGLEFADAGRVLIDGREMNGVPPCRRNVAMVFQGDALYPHLTIEQSLSVALKAQLTGEELRRRIGEATELVGIENILHRKPKDLSGGEQQRRAAVAKAMVRRCEVRLLDEPLSALDANVRHGIGEALLRWHEKYSGTTIHVTHDGQEAMRMADRIAVLDEGRIVQSASPQTIYERPVNRNVALSVGSPLMSFLEANLVDRHLSFSSQQVNAMGNRCRFDGEDQLVHVGVRSHAVRLLAPGGTPDESGILLSGRVTRTRLIDGRQIASVDVNRSLIDAEVAGHSLAAGDGVTIFVAADDLHVFSKTDGRRIPDARS